MLWPVGFWASDIGNRQLLKENAEMCDSVSKMLTGLKDCCNIFP